MDSHQRITEGPEGPRAARFTSDWFSHHIPNWEKWLSHLMDEREVHCLEVGSWEGRSALWIAKNILERNPKSTLWCVDTWMGSDEPAHASAKEGVYDRFANNVWTYLRTGKIVAVKGKSERALTTLSNVVMAGNLPLDFVYVDGSHMAADVLSDAILCFHILKVGGTMIIDDYEWNLYRDTRKTPKLGIDSFLACFAGRYDLIFKGTQVVLRKTETQQELRDAL